MTVQEAIAAAEVLLPGRAAPDGRTDPRWQAIIAVGEFIETEPDAVWLFIRRWGGSTNTDLRSAVATCLLEHLLENHFDRFIPLVEQAALEDQLFADTVCQCWKFGQAQESDRAVRLDRLVAAVRKRTV
jgi:hypothetical protein